MSMDSSVPILIKLLAGQLKKCSSIPGRGKIFPLFSTISRQVLKRYTYSMCIKDHPPEIKWPELEADDSPPSIFEARLGL